MKTIQVQRDVVISEVSTKQEALNAIESLLVYDDIEVEKYESLRRVIDFLDHGNTFDLGDGLCIKLIDTRIMVKNAK
jgi:hypothetical protein